MRVGVVGLGMMGLGIAANLAGKGYEVYGYDIDPARGKLLEEAGGHNTAGYTELGGQVDAAILMVFSPEILKDVLFGENGLAGALAPGSTVLVTATVGPDTIAEVEPKLADRGISVLDAALMANTASAREGAMHILVSGAPEVIEKNRKLLDDMSAELYFLGDRAGMAQAGKVCLQTLFSLTFETAFEVITLTRKLHLNMEEMDRLYRNSGSTSELFHETQANIEGRVFTGTFNPLSILDKDIHLTMDLAKKNHLDLPASEGTARVFREAMRHYGAEDIWAAVKVIEEERRPGV